MRVAESRFLVFALRRSREHHDHSPRKQNLDDVHGQEAVRCDPGGLRRIVAANNQAQFSPGSLASALFG
jgi:hypothetical protein